MDIAASIDFKVFNLPARAASPAPIVMQLDPGRVAVLDARGPLVIACLSGTLWLTLPGETEDCILHAGQSRSLTEPVRGAVLSGTGGSSAFAIRPAPGQTRQRIFGTSTVPRFEVRFA